MDYATKRRKRADSVLDRQPTGLGKQIELATFFDSSKSTVVGARLRARTSETPNDEMINKRDVVDAVSFLGHAVLIDAILIGKWSDNLSWRSLTSRLPVCHWFNAVSLSWNILHTGQTQHATLICTNLLFGCRLAMFACRTWLVCQQIVTRRNLNLFAQTKNRFTDSYWWNSLSFIGEKWSKHRQSRTSMVR